MVDIRETIDIAVQHHQAGHLQQAEQLYRLVLQSDPDHPVSLHSLGVIAHQTGKHDVAVDLIRRAIATNPQMPQFHNSIGVVFKALGRLEEAVHAYKQAVLLKPDYVEAYNNMGNALQAQGQYAEAVERYRQVVLLKPDYAEAYNNLAIALQMQSRYAEAIENCTQAVRLKPDYAQAYNTMASAMQMQGRYAEAIENYRMTLRLRPDYAEAHVNLGMALLLTGRFAQGWKQYEWRRKIDLNTATYPHRDQMSRWDGSSLAGSRLLIHCEQGLGDNLQFVRYLPMAKERGATVIFEGGKSLLGLLRGFPAVDELVEMSFGGNRTVNFDFCASLLDLPRIFGTTLETIPAEVPYIHADSRKAEYWKVRLADDGFKVGIVWAGKPTHKNDHNRSCALEHFVPLAQIPGIKLYGLQKGQAAKQAAELSDKITVTDIAEQFEDLTDTAAAIENLDLVISVDTSVPHLAGAMGKPVWILLPFTPDWRWMLDRQDSPWYPTMRLFRQKKWGDWDEVFHSVAENLRILVNKQRIGVVN